ncbi:peptide-methionine (S)-S-oxide reductase MsrA [Salinispirillum sp. LH 10-3-1]|uniref:Peptide methionine sulfoxide reductase MsrA n=1 Tax=Salinispirillum sp. LH 10-3-1 TaxID=2952525 RepID=A0AB38YI10_9GAMM
MGLFTKTDMPTSAEGALPGRSEPLSIVSTHAVNGSSMLAPFPAGMERIVLGLGCFWGAERLFWQMSGVFTTAVGYAGGYTPNPTYEETCTGQTGHTEVVLVVFDPKRLALDDILRTFWEAHDPTQGMRQGNDVGSQYRSAIYTSSASQMEKAQESLAAFQAQLSAAGLGEITTEVRGDVPFYYAETYHQQYLHKNPNGYCGLKGTGVVCAI